MEQTNKTNLGIRLEYNGGNSQNERIIKAKLESLKRAITASYQSATVVLPDNREFKCLINPDVTEKSLENKFLSIPYQSKCLNEESFTIEELDEFEIDALGYHDVTVAAGNVVKWKDNQTDWLVYLQKLEETAYFRAELRRCKYEIKIGENIYPVATGFKNKDQITWNSKSDILWNDLDYTIEMYITKNEETLDYFKRFTQIKMNEQNWEVQGVDNMNIEGVIVVALKEDYNNTIKDEIEAEAQVEDAPIEGEETTAPITALIQGETSVYPYEKHTYTVDESISGGAWSVSNVKAKIIEKGPTSADIEVVTGRSGAFIIYYTKDEQVYELLVTINSI